MAVVVIGAKKTERDLREIAHRLTDQLPVMQREMRVLEAAEVGVFSALGGRYVASGDVKRSLTLPDASGAIRHVSGRGVEFGTSIWYARYLTEHIGPVTPAGGMKRPKPVAVLKLSEATRRQVVRDTMDYVLGSAGGGTGAGAAMLGGML